MQAWAANEHTRAGILAWSGVGNIGSLPCITFAAPRSSALVKLWSGTPSATGTGTPKAAAILRTWMVNRSSSYSTGIVRLPARSGIAVGRRPDEQAGAVFRLNRC